MLLLLVPPRPSVAPIFPTNQRIAGFFLLSLLGLIASGIGCSSLNAGSTASTKPTQPIAIAAHLPPASVGSAYSAVLSVSGGSAPYTFSIRGGKFPPGLSINGTTGAITGHPARSGAYAFLISVVDGAHSAEGVQNFALTVSAHAAPVVQLSLSPSSMSLGSGASHQFAATVSNTSNHAVTWWASAGKITSAGLFTAPTVNAPAKVEIIATSNADMSKNAFATVSVNPAAQPSTGSSLAMTSLSLPAATEGIPYSAGLQATGGSAPYSWKMTTGSLPAGLSFSAAQALINGVATQNGTFPITIQATDHAGASIARAFTVNVSSASTGNFDGPAELPRVYIQSSMADTPAPGGSHPVSTTAALQSALNSAQCGETIALQAGATFNGIVVLPAKNCDDSHWIVLRTSAPDSALPPEGTRLTPCYAGVASLPGRPAFKCSSTRNVLAKIVHNDTGSGPIVLADGANHYRLLGLEITRGVPKTPVYNLVINENGGANDRIVIDRSWLHGTPQDETARGVALTASTNFAIVDSFFSDFHCVAITGSCGDAQAIAGGLGDKTMGPYKIVNNYLEASGENVIFGGGQATRTPEDIEIRHNYFFKPMIWMKGTPGFVGGRDGHPFIVKNHLEFKNAARVLVEGNVMENSWGGFSQAGFSILLTPKNQNGKCPLCVLHDVTIRYGTISNVGNGITIGNGPSDSGDLSLGAWNESIHDLVINHVNAKTYIGGGHLIQEANANQANPLRNVAISHLTGIADDPMAGMLVLGNAINHPLSGFSWTNNILTANGGGIVTTGGGAGNCAFPGLPGGALGKLDRCFNGYDFSGNVLIGPATSWPKNNATPASLTAVMFASAVHQLLSSFQLQTGSPFLNVGTDGKAPGADIAGVEAAISGVVW
jgi:Putative Ig domain